VNAQGNSDVIPASSGMHERRVEAAVRDVVGDIATDRPGAARFVAAALLGRGILASRTPGMHEAEGARLGLRYAYRLIDFDPLGLDDVDLEAVVAIAGTLGLNGLNVTHPFKEAVVGCLDAVSPDAAAIGAVNTVVFSDGRTTGHNTDVYGFAESFRRGLPGVKSNRVVLFGAGGGGMAVAHALLTLGVDSLDVVDRIPEKARSLAASLAGRFPGRRIAAAADAAAAVISADGVVNATPTGMNKYPGTPFDETLLRPGLWVADIVYFPAETALIRAARAAGCRTLGGSGMAIFQAIEAFHLISGVRADPDEMARHFASLPSGTGGDVLEPS
jgi:shikimate dehydrogenase